MPGPITRSASDGENGVFDHHRAVRIDIPACLSLGLSIIVSKR